MFIEIKYIAGLLMGGILAACVSCTHDEYIQNDKEPIKSDNMISEPDNKYPNNDYSGSSRIAGACILG